MYEIFLHQFPRWQCHFIEEDLAAVETGNCLRGTAETVDNKVAFRVDGILI
jgi:hypothetical protein